MKLSVAAGATSQSFNIFIQDSSSTTGAGLAGLTSTSTALTAFYTFPATAASSITISTALATSTGSYTSGGFVAVTNMAGFYRFDLPDAALASGKGRSVAILLSGATNMAPLPIEIELTGWDNQTGAVTSVTSNVGGNVVGSVTSVTSNVAGSVTSVSSNVAGSVTSVSSNVTGSVGSVTGAVTVGTNNDKTGYNVTSGTVTSVSSNVAGNVVGSVTSVSSNVAGSVASVTGAVGSVTGSVTVGTNNDKTGYALTSAEENAIADAILNRDMSVGTDSGSTSVRTPRQAFRFLRNKFAIVSGTLTVYKEDDVTSSWTGTVTASTSASPITANDPAGP